MFTRGDSGEVEGEGVVEEGQEIRIELLDFLDNLVLISTWEEKCERMGVELTCPDRG